MVLLGFFRRVHVMLCALSLLAFGAPASVSAEKLSVAATKVQVSDFSVSGLDEWEAHSFEGETHYTVATKENDILTARSDASASGLVKEVRVNLQLTPVLNWRWRIDKSLPPLDEETKSGDDYAARIYVIIDGGWLFWKTKALNLVWSSRPGTGARWSNAFAPENALMVALRGSDDGEGVWYSESVNVKALLEQWLGEEVSHIDAVAIMTDTDNSGLAAAASYGGLYFSAE